MPPNGTNKTLKIISLAFAILVVIGGSIFAYGQLVATVDSNKTDLKEVKEVQKTKADKQDVVEIKHKVDSIDSTVTVMNENIKEIKRILEHPR